MKWRGGRRSSNIDDRRGQRYSAMGGGGSGIVGLLFRFLPLLLRTNGGRGILVVVVVVFFGAKFLGIDLLGLLQGGLQGGTQGGTQGATQARAPTSAEENELADFVSVVLADTEATWHQQFKQLNKTYAEPTLVMFTGSVSSACGRAGASVGPFYCPADQKVYIDLSFYRDLKNRHQAPGDFAQAYVIAHEVGHHVQTLLGISKQVRQQKARISEAEANALSVRQELQADCFAGLWAHSANIDRALLEAGDLEEALVAASAIGDDRLQKQARGYVVPESFTHGTSAQRVKWFKRGFETGKLQNCDTFTSADL